MANTALLNPPKTSEMVGSLRRALNERVKRCESAMTDFRFDTHGEYLEAFGKLTVARAMIEDFETIVGTYERT